MVSAPGILIAMRAAGLLLTGGASRRMGRDKATLTLTPPGESLAGRTARLLAAVTYPAFEVGPGHSQLPAIAEGQPGAGPLAAVAAGRRALCAFGWTGAAVVVATDLPRLTVDLLSWLVEHPAPGSVIPVVQDVPQTLCARYAAADLERAVALVDAGRRSLRDLLNGSDALLAGPEEWEPAAGDPAALFDVDTPADLAQLGAHR